VSPLNAAAPLLALHSLPAARAARESGAQQTFRYIGSRTGVALTIAIATSSGAGEHGGTAGALSPLNMPAPPLAVESVPAARAATGSAAQ
jgi:hypothetical protein